MKKIITLLVILVLIAVGIWIYFSFSKTHLPYEPTQTATGTASTSSKLAPDSVITKGKVVSVANGAVEIQNGENTFRHFNVSSSTKIFDIYGQTADISAIEPGDTIEVENLKNGMLASIQIIGTQSQSVITKENNGETFTFTLTSRFSVVLPKDEYSASNLSCTPDGIIGGISNIPAVSPAFWVKRFAGVQPGSCILKNGDFQVKIIVPNTVSVNGVSPSEVQTFTGQVICLSDSNESNSLDSTGAADEKGNACAYALRTADGQDYALTDVGSSTSALKNTKNALQAQTSLSVSGVFTHPPQSTIAGVIRVESAEPTPTL
ncbi:MAG TPA: hypothetical protein VFM02_04565 [Candidatus Paceibacterota bacterium]|nr:hypothetical protein [Candidatus Paceibacterota bacterium]